MLVGQLKDSDSALVMAVRLNVGLQAVSASRTGEPWTVRVKKASDNGKRQTQVALAVESPASRLDERVSSFQSIVFKSNLLDPCAAVALMQAMQALLGEFETRIEERLRALDQDADY